MTTSCTACHCSLLLLLLLLLLNTHYCLALLAIQGSL
jgi:hypothetical protein